MLKYKLLEGVALADVAYKVYGKNLEELFVNAAEAVEQTMIDISTVNPLVNRKLVISNWKLEDLLLDFLNKLVFLKDSRQMIFSRFDICINKLNARPASPARLAAKRAGRRYQLNANLWGEKIDPVKHKLRCDVKAVTRHHLEVKKVKNRYIATIVLDI